MAKELPIGALRFVGEAGKTSCFAKKDADDKDQMEMVAYSGGLIKGHWYWGNLAIDLTGMKLAQKKLPILENHDTDKKVGFSNKVIIENQLKVEDVTFIDSEASNEFRKLSKEGFPYQSSIYGVPSKVERLSENESTQVNGMEVKGPASIWRNWTLKEASVCVFGWDSETKSKAFSRKEMQEVDLEEIGNDKEDDNLSKKEVNTVDRETLKKEHPDVFKQIQDEAVEEAKKQFQKEKDDLVAKGNATKDQLTKSNDRILGLEKKDAIRTENELANTAVGIWANKLAASEIPEHLYEKVQKHVTHTKFVKDGLLDAGKFQEAIDAEIKDWESKGVKSSVMGMSFTQKTETEDSKSKEEFVKENDDIANDLLSLAGQKQDKT